MVYENTIVFDYTGTKDVSTSEIQFKNEICVNFSKGIICIAKIVLDDIYWKGLSEC